MPTKENIQENVNEEMVVDYESMEEKNKIEASNMSTSSPPPLNKASNIMNMNMNLSNVGT